MHITKDMACLKWNVTAHMHVKEKGTIEHGMHYEWHHKHQTIDLNGPLKNVTAIIPSVPFLELG